MSRSPVQASASITFWFDPWITVRSDFAGAIIATLGMDFSPERRGAGRQRKRRARDQANLDAILHAIVANLARAVVAGDRRLFVLLGRPTAKPAGKRTVYERPGFRSLPKVLAHLERAGLLHVHKARKRGTASTIEPSAAFAKRARLAGLTAADFDRVYGEELVWISTPTAHVHQRHGRRPRTFSRPLDSVPEVRRYREECRKMNQATTTRLIGRPLSAATANRRGLNGPEDVDAIMHRSEGPGAPDFQGCTLRRYFHDDKLETGGRLYGGWWQVWPKSERHKIRINGEPVACVDFQSVFPRLAYVHVGKAPPVGDSYAGIPGDREGVKIVFNAMLFRDTPLKRLPRDTRQHFPPHVSAADVRNAIRAKHPSLRSIFERGVGLRLMRLESDILVAACLELIDQGVVPMPIHDAVLVPQSKAGFAAHVMEHTAQRLTGWRLPVGIERYAPPC